MKDLTIPLDINNLKVISQALDSKGNIIITVESICTKTTCHKWPTPSIWDTFGFRIPYYLQTVLVSCNLSLNVSFWCYSKLQYTKRLRFLPQPLFYNSHHALTQLLMCRKSFHKQHCHSSSLYHSCLKLTCAFLASFGNRMNNIGCPYLNEQWYL